MYEGLLSLYIQTWTGSISGEYVPKEQNVFVIHVYNAILHVCNAIRHCFVLITEHVT